MKSGNFIIAIRTFRLKIKSVLIRISSMYLRNPIPFSSLGPNVLELENWFCCSDLTVLFFFFYFSARSTNFRNLATTTKISISSVLSACVCMWDEIFVIFFTEILRWQRKKSNPLDKCMELSFSTSCVAFWSLCLNVNQIYGLVCVCVCMCSISVIRSYNFLGYCVSLFAYSTWFLFVFRPKSKWPAIETRTTCILVSFRFVFRCP